MSLRNATASWSGYSHQGQVGLLIALRKLQELDLNLNSHYVEFEKHEDVAIYELSVSGDKIYLSVHQVKAYYSEGNANKSTYTNVLNGNFEPGNQRFLHTVVEISDWNTSVTTNNNNVERYPYTATQFHCGTTDIETFIKNELVNILGTVAPEVINAAYYRLSFELDHRIRQEHQKRHKSLFDIKFSLSEIDNLVRSNALFEEKDIYDCRKLFYDTYIEIIRTHNITQERITVLESGIIKEINALNNEQFLLLLQRMNLNEKPEKLKLAPVYYNGTGLKQVFFRMLIEIVDTNPTLIESVVKYVKTGISGKFVVTAIVEEERDQLTVVENILTNLKSQNLLWENHWLINKELEITLVSRNPSIAAIASNEQMEDDKDRFMSFTNSKLVKREEAKNLLNNGTNH